MAAAAKKPFSEMTDEEKIADFERRAREAQRREIAQMRRQR